MSDFYNNLYPYFISWYGIMHNMYTARQGDFFLSYASFSQLRLC